MNEPAKNLHVMHIRFTMYIHMSMSTCSLDYRNLVFYSYLRTYMYVYVHIYVGMLPHCAGLSSKVAKMVGSKIYSMYIHVYICTCIHAIIESNK